MSMVLCSVFNYKHKHNDCKDDSGTLAGNLAKAGNKHWFGSQIH